MLLGVRLATVWYEELTAPITCTSQFPNPTDHNGYVQFQLDSQHASEPMFEGRLMILLTPREYSEPAPTSLRYRRSGDQNYGDQVGTLKLTPLDGGDLQMPDFREIGLINVGRVHRWFPFDSARFDFNFALEPVVAPGYITITNRVPGFVINCPKPAHRKDNGSLDIQCELKRSPLVQWVAAILCLSGLLFGILIVFGIKGHESLATAVASFFFALWSIRHIVASEIAVFPTFMDMYILSLNALMLMALLWRVLRESQTSA